MYNTKVVCTYHLDDVFNEKDNISDKEKEFIRDAIYRQELLDILGIDEFNEDKMGKAFHELYLRIESFKELKECMQQMAARFLSEDVELGLMILFAYDYMYLTHACICEYLDPPLGKVEPNTSEGSEAFQNTSEGSGAFQNTENIKALIQRINN
jgi:replicative superfamily II helicase